MNTRTGQSGYTLIEVLVGIVIFALGLLALVQLQGSLAKSSAESNARTVAINVAEEEIERLRTFGQITASGTLDAFNNIVTGSRTESRGNMQYTLNRTVVDYYYNPATGAFQDTAPNDSVGNADLKRVELTVSWAVGDNAQSFRIDESNTASDVSSGSITLVDLISTFTTKSGVKVALNNTGGALYSPPVDYIPGQNPDIIPIHLGETKFKESTTPLPDVIRADELVETRFDVVTYSQDNSGATFLRREEFRVVSCECTLQVPTYSGQGGYRPAIWNGSDYSAGEFVAKPYGESANNQQSDLCDVCCRDHHDGGVGEDDVAGDPGRSLYGPFRADTDYHTSGAMNGDHKHYNRDRNGNLQLVDQAGEVYVEACRLVRKDGFFRLAQDMRQEGLNSFPGNYMDEDGEIEEYSDYVTAAVSGYESQMGISAAYEDDPPQLTRPADMTPAVLFPASTTANPTIMSDTFAGITEQQLRSRGIYIDYMSDELREKINCLDDNKTGEECHVPAVNSALEIIPFYDVQLTWLSRWNETPSNNPIDVTNQAISDHNQHSRGLATLETGYGNSTIITEVHEGNLGLVGTDPIDPAYVSDLGRYLLFARAMDESNPPPMSGIRLAGTITSSVGGVKAADVEILATGAQCDRTSIGFECVVEAEAKFPELKVYNYFKKNKDLYACSADMEVHGQEHSGDTPDLNWTRFYLPLETNTSMSIVIREGGC